MPEEINEEVVENNEAVNEQDIAPETAADDTENTTPLSVNAASLAAAEDGDIGEIEDIGSADVNGADGLADNEAVEAVASGEETSVNGAAVAATALDDESGESSDVVAMDDQAMDDQSDDEEVDAAADSTQSDIDAADSALAEETEGVFEVAGQPVDEEPDTFSEQVTAAQAAGEIEETGDAAAVSTAISEAEADAAIEAAGVEQVSEGRSPGTVDVADTTAQDAEPAVSESVTEPIVEESGPEESGPTGELSAEVAEAEAHAEESEAEVAEAEAHAEETGAEVAETEAHAEEAEVAEALTEEAEDGGEGAVEGTSGEKKRRRRRKQRARRSLDSFKPGEEIEGTVRTLQPYGAFVDVGAERDGLVHISELRDGFVEKVEDVVQQGEKVAVRVKEVDTDRGRLSLTMRSEQSIEDEKEQRQRIRLRDLSEGQEILGTVTSIVDFGAFVDIGARTDGLIHISELSEERVNRVNDVVSEGEEVTVRILSVDRRRNRISLTMKEQSAEEDFVYEEDDDEEPPTLMELAFARARDRNNKKDRSRKGQSRSESSQKNVLSDIIDRTLEEHSDK